MWLLTCQLLVAGSLYSLNFFYLANKKVRPLRPLFRSVIMRGLDSFLPADLISPYDQRATASKRWSRCTELSLSILTSHSRQLSSPMSLHPSHHPRLANPARKNPQTGYTAPILLRGREDPTSSEEEAPQPTKKQRSEATWASEESSLPEYESTKYKGSLPDYLFIKYEDLPPKYELSLTGYDPFEPDHQNFYLVCDVQTPPERTGDFRVTEENLSEHNTLLATTDQDRFVCCSSIQSPSQETESTGHI
ncbi:hypothetical protein QBC36DRAFT_107527 [Triangularia setosa]|uniref:Uncharacterized protein n=1 Tax=Triangularia setosa TaxID=2587417 RepID=A0AAN6WFX2_9PEZI|nr:hypothetical protein QBC36DRAFT_107527 [Podospora setosa]